MAGILLIHPQAYGAESFHCTLPNGEQVEFYQMVPLYADELDFKLRNGAEALLRYMNEEALEVVDPARESACRYVVGEGFCHSQRADPSHAPELEGAGGVYCHRPHSGGRVPGGIYVSGNAGL